MVVEAAMRNCKISVKHPRPRGPEGGILLESYETLKKPGGYSKEILDKISGVSLPGSVRKP
jgi:hypothetical protein